MGVPNRTRQAVKAEDFAITSTWIASIFWVITTEIAAGVELSSSRERNMSPFLAALETLDDWPFDRIAAFKYGQIFAEQRKKGRRVQVVDMMIAAVATTLGKMQSGHNGFRSPFDYGLEGGAL